MAGNSSAPYGSAPFGSAQPHNYRSTIPAQPPSYGSAQSLNYGSSQPPNYGSAVQAPNTYGASQALGYRTQTPTQAAPTPGGGSYEAPHGGNTVRRGLPSMRWRVESSSVMVDQRVKIATARPGV